MRRSILISIVLVMTAPALWSQQPQPTEHMHGQEGMPGMQHMESTEGMKSEQPMGQEAMMAHCKAMMAKHESMLAEMQAAQQRLENLVANMNTASGDEKVDAVAAVVEELVARQQLEQSEMMEMHPQMMRHMMEHMQTATEPGGMGSMMDCPMMKEMMKEGMEPVEGSDSPTPGDEHAKHHPQR